MRVIGSISPTFLPLFSAGAMAYGATRAFQDTSSSPTTYLGISVSAVALQSSLVAITSPVPGGIGVNLATLACATAFQGIIQYSAMKAGEQIGIAARKPENRELR